MERQAALLFVVLYEVQYCVLKLFFFLKGDSSLLEESSIQADHTVFCWCGQQKSCGCNLKFSSIQEIRLSPLSLLGNYSHNLERLLRPDPMKKRSESSYTLLEGPCGWWATDLHSSVRDMQYPSDQESEDLLSDSNDLCCTSSLPLELPWGYSLSLLSLPIYCHMHFPRDAAFSPPRDIWFTALWGWDTLGQHRPSAPTELLLSKMQRRVTASQRSYFG